MTSLRLQDPSPMHPCCCTAQHQQQDEMMFPATSGMIYWCRAVTCSFLEPKDGATVPGTIPIFSTTHPKRSLVLFLNIKLLLFIPAPHHLPVLPWQEKDARVFPVFPVFFFNIFTRFSVFPTFSLHFFHELSDIVRVSGIRFSMHNSL